MKLSIGSKIRIRSEEWFNYNKGYGRVYSSSMRQEQGVGDFLIDMSEYCGMEAQILNCYDKDSNNIYKLDIDDEGWSWQDYMFDIGSVINIFTDNFCRRCNNIYNPEICINCLLNNVNDEIISVGDVVKIRSLEWFRVNRFLDISERDYCGMMATVTDKIVVDSGNNIYLYSLDISNSKILWPDFMFDVSTIYNNIISKYCKNYCVYECREENCLFFDKIR